ncbi:unnamed protein product [Ectocarpus sp. 13 AM-2016]
MFEHWRVVYNHDEGGTSYTGRGHTHGTHGEIGTAAAATAAVERSRCLDAFIVALSQACEGGGKQWYASTLELQLTSLDFCRACRSVPTLDVAVDKHTPRSLWAPHTTQTRPITRSSKVARISSRVPAVRAAGLTWGASVRGSVGEYRDGAVGMVERSTTAGGCGFS